MRTRGALLLFTLLMLAIAVVRTAPPPLAAQRSAGHRSSPTGASPTAIPSPSPLGSPAEGLTRSDGGEGGGRVSVTWLTPEYLRGRPGAAADLDPQRYLLFRVVVESPSSRMSAWDLKGMIFLREEGGKEYGTPIWRPTQEGGHMEGLAAFPSRDARDNPVPRLEARYVELVIRGLSGVPERVFRWNLGR